MLRSEVEAIHGKRFNEPWLQQYFDERYWYKASDNYDPKEANCARAKEPGDDRRRAEEVAEDRSGARATWSYLRTS